MIKFFRKIRYNLMEQNKTGKYLKYAIGEIVLVMIGILLALQVNNWNENRKHAEEELQLLTSLLNDVTTDIEELEEEEIYYLNMESNAKKAIELFYKARSAKDIIEIEALKYERWTTLIINKSAYNELLNTGNFYSIKDNGLKNLIGEYYLKADDYQFKVIAVIKLQSEILNNSDLYAYKMMLEQSVNPQVAINRFDTSWIDNPKSATYLTLNRYLQDNLTNYLGVKMMSIEDLLLTSKQLKKELNKEIEQRN